MNSDRFRFFPSVYRESDLWIGVPHHNYDTGMLGIAHREQRRLYGIIEENDRRFPGFIHSLEPIDPPSGSDSLNGLLLEMYRTGKATGTGPMSCVAGLFAREVADRILGESAPDEIVVENGGDLHLRNTDDLLTVIHAGPSVLSGKLGLLIPPGTWGICTSSGTHGHSFSRGNADAVCVVSSCTPLADAWATALGNRIRGQADIEPVLDDIPLVSNTEDPGGIAACVIVVGDRMGIRGAFDLKPLN